MSEIQSYVIVADNQFMLSVDGVKHGKCVTSLFTQLVESAFTTKNLEYVTKIKRQLLSLQDNNHMSIEIHLLKCVRLE